MVTNGVAWCHMYFVRLLHEWAICPHHLNAMNITGTSPAQTVFLITVPSPSISTVHIQLGTGKKLRTHALQEKGILLLQMAAP